MNLNSLLRLKTRNNPDSLLDLQIRVAIVSILIVVALGSYGFYRVFSGYVVKNAEQVSVQLCRVLIEEQKELIFITQSGKPVDVGIHGAAVSQLDHQLRLYLSPFNIIKVKIYNSEKRIVYSTEPALVGKVDSNNIRLKNALAGTVDARMVTKEKASDLADEPLRDVDVVETYVPILSPDNRVLGSFEVYMNMTGYRDQIRQGMILATSILVFVLGAVFGFSYLLIRGGTRQLKEVQNQLELVAITDPLTGRYNRGYLMRRGEEEFARVRRSARPLGCIMIDLDEFKRVNDTRGHAAGDRILAAVAERLQSSVRQYDVVGRYGGEEFMVLLPDATFEQIAMVATRICELIRDTPFELDSGELLSVTISLGVASYSKADLTLGDLIKRADDGLYKAKADGRNRVAWIFQPGAGDTPV